MTHTIVKIAIVGEGDSEKTTIAARIATGQFIDPMITVGIYIETWTISDEDTGGMIRAAVFDLGGAHRFRFFQHSLLIGIDAVIIVVDVTMPRSVIDLDQWIPTIQHVPRDRWLLVTNKADAQWDIDPDEIQSKSEELGVPYFIVSAKTEQGLSEFVNQLVRLILGIANGNGLHPYNI